MFSTVTINKASFPDTVCIEGAVISITKFAEVAFATIDDPVKSDEGTRSAVTVTEPLTELSGPNVVPPTDRLKGFGVAVKNNDASASTERVHVGNTPNGLG